MTYTVVWEPAAVNLATAFLSDDKDGLTEVFLVVDTLVDQPRPPSAFAMGRSGMYRIRIGRYRVVYEIDEAEREVKVRHVGRRS